MKRIICYYVADSSGNATRMLAVEHANPSLRLENGNWFFQSEEGTKQQVQISTDQIVFDEQLANTLCELLKAAIETAINWEEDANQDTVGKENVSGSAAAVVQSLVSKASYETPKSVFHFCAFLFADFLMKHKLKNGNKRVATLLLAYSLRLFGYQLEWAHESTEEWKTSRTIVERFVEKMENKDGRKTESATSDHVEEIASWIRDGSVVALEWRGTSENNGPGNSIAYKPTEDDLQKLVANANENKKLRQLIKVLAKR